MKSVIEPNPRISPPILGELPQDQLERLQLALDSAEIGLWDWDMASDELWWSERQFALFGIQAGNFSRRGVQILENIHQEDRKRIQASIDQAANSLVPFNEEFRVVHPDGAVRWLAGRAQPYYPPESRTLRMIGVNFDITERKDAELEREKYIHLENLAQMHRLHMAGEIAALLSHQLNQPLTAIRSFAEAGLARLRRAEQDPARMQQTLEDVVAQSERAASSIRELRKFLARQPQEKLCADYNATIRSACRLMEVLARGRGINLKLELDASPPTLEMRPSQIEQVLVNLVENAIAAIYEAGEASGEIHVIARYDSHNKEIITVVQDSGPGLSTESVKRVFDPLYTTKKNGIGMGLVISRKIIEDHGGRIWAEAGKGGRFVFTLPLVP